jgi:hypothetical protein
MYFTASSREWEGNGRKDEILKGEDGKEIIWF